MNPLSLMAPSLLATWSAIPLAAVVYALLLHDARRKDSPAAEDTQLGLKTVAAVLIVVSTIMFATGLRDLLHVLLTFDEFWDRFKAAFPTVLIGGVGVFGVAMVLLPRTNADEYPKAKRIAAGIIAIGSGVALLPALAGLITQVLDWPSWAVVAGAFATAVDALAIFGISFMVLGKLSGVKMPEMKAAAPQAAAQPQGAMAGQQQAYPGQQQQQPQQQYQGQPPQQQAYPGQQQQQPQQQQYQGQPGQQQQQGWPPQGQ